MKRHFYALALGVVLLTQLFVELFPLLFVKGSLFEEYGYYIPMRLFHIGVLPSIILLYFCKTRIEKVVCLTLLISQIFWAIREFVAFIGGFDWLVLEVSSLDGCLIVFAILPLILSILTDAIIFSSRSGRSRISLLL